MIWANCLFSFNMSLLFRTVEDVTTISKSQSLTSVSIKTAPWEFQTKLLHYFFTSNNKSNLHFKGWQRRKNEGERRERMRERRKRKREKRKEKGKGKIDKTERTGRDRGMKEGNGWEQGTERTKEERGKKETKGRGRGETEGTGWEERKERRRSKKEERRERSRMQSPWTLLTCCTLHMDATWTRARVLWYTCWWRARPPQLRRRAPPSHLCSVDNNTTGYM